MQVEINEKILPEQDLVDNSRSILSRNKFVESQLAEIPTNFRITRSRLKVSIGANDMEEIDVFNGDSLDSHSKIGNNALPSNSKLTRSNSINSSSNRKKPESTEHIRKKRNINTNDAHRRLGDHSDDSSELDVLNAGDEPIYFEHSDDSM
jgi:hypothetical protein